MFALGARAALQPGMCERQVLTSSLADSLQVFLPPCPSLETASAMLIVVHGAGSEACLLKACSQGACMGSE